MAEINQEAFLANRRLFNEFLDPDNPNGEQMRRIRQMQDAKKHRLIVDLTDLRNFDNQLARRLIRQPGEYLPALHKAAEDAVRRFDPKYLDEVAADSAQVGFEGPLGFHSVTPRELLSPFLNTLVCVRGIVTKCSSVRPKVVRSTHYCPRTRNFLSREYRDVTALTGLPTNAVYPTKDDNGNLLVTEYGLCKYIDNQALAIQEMPENSPPGQLPRSVDVVVEDDLVDVCKPGDRVAIYGVYKALPQRTVGTMSGTFRTVLVANNVQQLSKEMEGPKQSAADIRSIKQVAARADAWDVLAESIAPSIYGHRWIKKGLLLLLLGGMEKNLDNGTHIRGDLNMLMVGDPSVAKSQLLRAIMSVAPLAISTNGRGSSGVGLTAAVTTDQDTGERRLEAGAMVLADRGIVCVDEFDKMSDMDRVAIHEVMEQQTVTIAKAGIHATLNARCSVLAAANPIYGSYDHSLTPTRNIALPDSLLSRFDLLFVVVDHMDAEMDRRIAEHVLRMHRYRPPGDDGTMVGYDMPVQRYDDDDDDNEDENEGEGAPSTRGKKAGVYVKFDRMLYGDRRGAGRPGGAVKDLVTRKFLKKFIHYAKGRTPRLTDEAVEKIAQAYGEMRAQGMDPSRKAATGGTLPVTTRSLETIIRLSTAHAKLKLHREVKASDVAAALKLIDFALYHRELDEVDKKLEEEKEKAQADAAAVAAAAATAAAAGEGAAEAAAQGGEARERRDDSSRGAAETRAQAAKRQRTERGTASRHAGSDDADMADADAGADAGEARAEDRGGAGPSVLASRVEQFQHAFSEHAMAARIQSITIDELVAVVNRRFPTAPFAREEAETILAQMEDMNRVMYTQGVIHLI